MDAERGKSGPWGGGAASDPSQDYRVYTTQFDRLVGGDEIPDLFDPGQNAAFDEYVAKLDPYLARWRAATALAMTEEVKASGSDGEIADTVACLLLDHSGSLKGKPAVLATAVAETIADHWSSIGIRYEILGFTTVSWKGGQSRERWIAAGKPENPGRLCDRLHIIYRTADDGTAGPPASVRNLARDDLLKENVDGEAVGWAAGRLRDRSETRKILVVVSDGIPCDASTIDANSASYLDRHLERVVASIDAAGDIWVAGIGLGYDPSRYYRRHLSVTSTRELPRVVRFAAGHRGGPIPRPLQGPEQDHFELDEGQPPISKWFYGLVSAFLGLAAVMLVLPDLAGLAVFPFVLVGWVISLCVHEYGHAIAAYRGGDQTVRDKGYLTLDPMRYTDVGYSIVWPLLFLAMGGIGLPGGAVYVNTTALRGPSQRSLVSAAGPLGTLAVLILLLGVLAVAEGSSAVTPPLYAALSFLAFLQLTALVFNLLPIPGLDGWGIIQPWLPGAAGAAAARLAHIAPFLLLAAFLFVPAVNEMFWSVVIDVSRTIGLDMGGAMQGLRLFRFWR
jgi:Zn-dependent protease